MASNSIIPYGSSSSCDLIKRYDVFVSFRGIDIRNSFADHLFAALRRNSINCFKDDTKIKKGKYILPELLQAIQGSQILVVVFSKKYASSKWCLRELEKIASCIDVEGKHVLPIFYDVTPSDVRYQSGDYEEAFDKHEKRFKEDEVKRWRQALSKVAHLSGWDIGNKPQSEQIDKVVQEIQKKLPKNIVSLRTGDLVGIELPVEKLEKLLLWDSVDDDVMSLGIYGMPGIGKTTLIKAVCNRIHHYFEFNFFLHDVSKICENANVDILRKYLLGQDPGENSLILENYNVLSQINSLSNGRRLIVLDNVGYIEQLEKLNLDHQFLSPGSRIIIISKDKGILEDYGVNHVHHVQPLNNDNTLQLFYKYAFKGNNIMSEYEKVKYDVLSYCEGHPLLIKVLGRHLAYQKNVLQWHGAIAKLRESPKKDIRDKLRISFDELEQNEKEIFLDIACFYNWYHNNIAMEVLRFRGFEPESGLKILHEKSLITYYDKQWVEMPSLLIDLGKYIIKEESPKEPRQRSRLWDYQDLFKVLLDKEAPTNLEAIIVEKCNCTTIEEVDALAKMSQLKLLILADLVFSGSLNDLSNELRYLIWERYQFKRLPPYFQPNNLVQLVMRDSNIKRLWKGTKALPNLKYLDVQSSKNLVEMPNLKEAPNLKWLNFEGCIQLRIIHQSVGSLRELIYLNFKDCISLVSLPISLLGLSSLKWFNLSGCSKLYNTPSLEEAKDAKHFNKPWIGEAPFHSKSTSSSIEEKSFMCGASSLLSSPTFPCMCDLNLSFCNLHQIPDAIVNLCCLERLDLSGNKFKKVPSLKKLSKLIYINLEHCKKLKYLFELPSQTEITSDENIYMSLPYNVVMGRRHDYLPEGLNIFNCGKLVESEEWSRMSMAWMLQMIKAKHHPLKLTNIPWILRMLNEGRQPWRTYYIKSVIPGNEIPRWFNNLGVGIGNTIRVVGSPPRQDESKLIDVAVCAVFSVSNVKLSNPIGRPTYLPHSVPILLGSDLVTDKSDHMFLFYLTWSYGSLSAANKSRGIIISDDEELIGLETDYCDWSIKVKKYGYRLIYKSDPLLSNIPSKHCNNSSNRKRKFLEIKDKQ